MKLLINADDLGYTPAITRAIFDLHRRGKIFSASLLVNMPHRQQAIDGLRAHPNLGVGVHLNLTKGAPLLSAKRIPSLLSARGEFWPTKQLFARAAARQIDMDEVEDELRAQIEYVLDCGIRPTHLDSHSHWHLLPHLRQLITRLAACYRIPGIRQAALRRTLVPALLGWVAASPQSEAHLPDYMLSLHYWMKPEGQPHNQFFSPKLRQLIARPEISLELVTHPGALHDPDFPPDTLLTHQRQWEYDFLLSPRFDAWLQMMGAVLVSYPAL